MKRPAPMRYEDAVTLVALNDNPQDMALKSITATVTVQLLADIYGARAESVARDVIRVRKHARREDDR